jgi:hypothetical protein
VSTTRAFTASADPSRPMPGGHAARLDRIEIATASLRAELARLERLGLEPATSLCREQLRYWEFLNALFSIAADVPCPGEAA